MSVEIFDNLTKSIRVMRLTKATHLIKHNGIVSDAKGNAVGGRYIKWEKVGKEALLSAGITEIEVADEIKGETYIRSFVEKKEPVKVEKVEETPTDTETEIEEIAAVEEKPVVKKTRKPRAKKESK